MSRLERRLGINKMKLPETPSNQEEEYLPDSGQYSPKLAEQYDRTQMQAQEDYDKDRKALDATNPHTLYTDIIANPSPKGLLPITIMGRPIDVNMLENYVVFKISPRTVTTLMRYNDSKTTEELKGYSKRKPIRMNFKVLIMVIVFIVIMLVVGYLFLSGGMTSVLGGLLGGF